MPVVFAVTVFVNAALLFAVEPLIARMVLPHLGGTPGVWNTCMVFFQAVLLAGYALAHGLSRWLGARSHSVLWVWLLMLGFLVLPIHLPEYLLESAPREADPIPWLMVLLLAAVGLPFLVLSTTGPLLQQWFAGTDHPAAQDPYFLYAASNLGSMLALLSYPWLVEPNLRLCQQGWLWSGGYWLLAVLTLGCAALLRPHPGQKGHGYEANANRPSAVTAGRRFQWAALAFVPSSLMLGVTTYLSTDIATIPLLWIVPLALYLLTFILVFSRRRLVSRRAVRGVLPVGVLLLTILLAAEDMQPPLGLLLGLHLLTFFLAGLFCHGELARDRPPATQLTEFYLWLAVGGVLGGLFNALVAPLVFPRILEYPVALVLLCLLRRTARPLDRSRCRLWLDGVLPLALGGLTIGLVMGLQTSPEIPSQVRIALGFGVPAVLCYTFVDRPVRFALGVAAILVGSLFYTGAQGRPLYTERSFFGVLRVTLDPTGTYYQLVHGNTVHGRQHLHSGAGERAGPLAYYHRGGPIGQVLEGLRPRLPEGRIGVVGLGVGSLAWYATPGQEWTFYEIDPAVKRIAEDARYFTFLKECRARRLDVVLGDARLRLCEAPAGQYDVLVLDAFSSDAVPVHLLTREALRLYLAKLDGEGVLAFHVSNRYLDLKPVLAKLAEDAQLFCRYREDLTVTPAEKAEGKSPSLWVVMTRSRANLGKLAWSARWFPLDDYPGMAVWTDDFSNLLSLMKWTEGSGD